MNRNVLIATVIGLLFVVGPVYALEYECTISGSKAYCDIPLEPYWNKIKQVYQNVKTDISVGATEYDVGENATIFAKVTLDGDAISGGFCDGLVFYPNQSEYTGFSLSYINNSRGIYSAIIQVPDDIGVYPVDIKCYKPYNSTFESRYFNRESNSDRLQNTTNNVSAFQTMENQGSGASGCCIKRFREYESDRDVEWTDYGFIDSVSNIAGYWSQSRGSSDWELFLNFYKITDKGTVFLGTAKGIAELSSTPAVVNYSDIVIDYPFASGSLLQVHNCWRRVSGAGLVDLTFHYNSSQYDSGFVMNTVEIEEPADFVVGGASEMNVKDVGHNLILTLLRHARILHNRIVDFKNDEYCISNTTLRHNITYEYCEDSKCKILSDIMDENCVYGCDLERDKCIEAPFISNIIIFGVIFILIVVLGIFGWRL